MRKKILLLGSEGFFGKNIRKLLSNNYKIKSFTRRSKIENLNLKDYFLIINCAAEVYNEKKMFNNNTELVEQLLRKIINSKCKVRLIHFGSSGEYGSVNKISVETDASVPRSIYESTKASATMLVQGYSKQYKIKSIIIRPFAVFGKWENHTRLIPNIFRHFLYDKKLDIYDGYHDFIYIKELLNFINFLIKKNKINKHGELVNFGSGKQFSNIEILNLCEKIIKKKAKFRFIKKFQRMYDKKIWCSNNRYLISKMKFKRKFTIKKAIKDYYKEIIKDPSPLFLNKNGKRISF